MDRCSYQTQLSGSLIWLVKNSQICKDVAKKTEIKKWEDPGRWKRYPCGVIRILWFLEWNVFLNQHWSQRWLSQRKSVEYVTLWLNSKATLISSFMQNCPGCYWPHWIPWVKDMPTEMNDALNWSGITGNHVELGYTTVCGCHFSRISQY